MGRQRLVVFGTGSLARALCCSLADLRSGELQVTIVGRRPRPAEELAYLAASRARISGTAVTFAPSRLDFEPAPLRELLARLDPALVVLCASRQSPWEKLYRPSAWTDLVTRGGFGLTLPFHADLAVRVSTAVAAGDCGADLVNACYPDAVNPLLTALGLPVLCGVGNAGLVAASLAGALAVERPERLKVLAHHAHLSQPDDASDEALAWLDGKPVDGVSQHLAEQRRTGRERLNLVTGHTASRLVAALLHSSDWATSVPGPRGLPGGYPVRIRNGTLSLALPPGMTRAAATEWNRRVGRHDGVDVAHRSILIGERARDALRQSAGQDIAEECPAGAFGDMCAVMEKVRARLRASPAQLREDHGPTYPGSAG